MGEMLLPSVCLGQRFSKQIDFNVALLLNKFRIIKHNRGMSIGHGVLHLNGMSTKTAHEWTKKRRPQRMRQH